MLVGAEQAPSAFLAILRVIHAPGFFRALKLGRPWIVKGLVAVRFDSSACF
ncbi:Uncharacterised protein [Mycobacteroides abscessus subsp. abscessus]|nr:Uncharacterised protein [Mycobacteroides abscessus subsp. abscessus]